MGITDGFDAAGEYFKHGCRVRGSGARLDQLQDQEQEGYQIQEDDEEQESRAGDTTDAKLDGITNPGTQE
jgi:hypothetical protein